MVGRRVELETIAAALDRATSGAGREVVLVSGEAGVGRTTVLAQAARDAFDGGACELFGHAEADLTAPYQLFAESLGHLVTNAQRRQLVAHVSWRGPELARLVPELRHRLPELRSTSAADADTERYQMFPAVAQLLDSWSRFEPIVLVLDDLQWAEVNVATHTETCAVPTVQLEIERPLLRPLPSLRPRIGHAEARAVDKLSTIRVASARYSAPCVLRGRRVEAVTFDGIRSNNPQERLNKELRRRTDVVASSRTGPPSSASSAPSSPSSTTSRPSPAAT